MVEEVGDGADVERARIAIGQGIGISGQSIDSKPADRFEMDLKTEARVERSTSSACGPKEIRWILYRK